MIMIAPTLIQQNARLIFGLQTKQIVLNINENKSKFYE
jgi:hypothetical protein